MVSQNPLVVFTRWAPTSYKWSYKPYKLPYKWVTGVITLLIGVITPFITSRGPTLYPPPDLGKILNKNSPKLGGFNITTWANPKLGREKVSPVE